MKAMIFLGLLSLTLFLSSCGETRRFDSAQWKDGSDADRCAMVGDLIASKQLIGKTLGEVEMILGDPRLRRVGVHAETLFYGPFGPCKRLGAFRVIFEGDPIVVVECGFYTDD
jgi:hypothetical protein